MEISINIVTYCVFSLFLVRFDRFKDVTTARRKTFVVNYSAHAYDSQLARAQPETFYIPWSSQWHATLRWIERQKYRIGASDKAWGSTSLLAIVYVSVRKIAGKVITLA